MLPIAFVLMTAGAPPAPAFTVVNKCPQTFTVVNLCGPSASCPCVGTGCLCGTGLSCNCGPYCGCPACPTKTDAASTVPYSIAGTTSGGCANGQCQTTTQSRGRVRLFGR